MARLHTVNQPRRLRARAVNHDRTPATGTRVRCTHDINPWRPTATRNPVAKRTQLVSVLHIAQETTQLLQKTMREAKTLPFDRET